MFLGIDNHSVVLRYVRYLCVYVLSFNIFRQCYIFFASQLQVIWGHIHS